MPAGRVDLEGDRNLLVFVPDPLSFQVHRQLHAGVLLGLLHDEPNLFFGKPEGEQAVLEAVVVEDIGETGRNDALDAVVSQCPGGMLPGGTAAEIVAGHQDFGVTVVRLIEHEIGVGTAVLIVPPRGEQDVLVPGTLNALEVDRRDNDVGVDIHPVQGRHHAGEFDERVHNRPLGYQISWRLRSKPGSTASPDTISGSSKTSTGSPGR